MESSEAASRRMRCVANHLSAAPQNSLGASLATVVCSSTSGSKSSSRKDGRLLYARQNSHVPAYFKEIKDAERSNAATQAIFRKDSRLMFARQGCHTQAYFMRVLNPMEKKDSCSQLLQSRPDNVYMFSKASSDLKTCAYRKHDTNGEPFFARPSFDDLDWRPRMDVAELKFAHVVTMELPGLNADHIRVAVNNDRLLVSGSRSMDLWIDNDTQSEEAFYHQRELSQGPFSVQWPIPKNSNINSISAEYMDGFLRILVPKNSL